MEFSDSQATMRAYNKHIHAIHRKTIKPNCVCLMCDLMPTKIGTQIIHIIWNAYGNYYLPTPLGWDTFWLEGFVQRKKRTVWEEFIWKSTCWPNGNCIAALSFSSLALDSLIRLCQLVHLRSGYCVRAVPRHAMPSRVCVCAYTCMYMWRRKTEIVGKSCNEMSHMWLRVSCTGCSHAFIYWSKHTSHPSANFIFQCTAIYISVPRISTNAHFVLCVVLPLLPCLASALSVACSLNLISFFSLSSFGSIQWQHEHMTNYTNNAQIVWRERKSPSVTFCHRFQPCKHINILFV